jgi:uncharacterized protein (TIGR00369 family)
MLSFLEEVFPQVNGKIEILNLTESSSSIKLRVTESDLRPGGTVSGPSMFLLADVTFYIAVLAAIGKKPLAVTTNCSINFMRKPNPNDLIADARILKKGRSLIVGDVLLRSSMNDLTVAQASFTYAIPRKEL